MDELKWLHEHWSAITADPWPFVFVAVIAAAVAFGILTFLFRERIEILKSRAERAEAEATKAKTDPSSAPQADAPAALTWAGQVDIKFLLEEQDLWIVLKDGHTFFTDRREALAQRLAGSDLKTTIMILHPDYAHIAAVADMDPNKRGKPDMQVKDCRFAVQTLHDLRNRLIADGRDDIAKTVKFIGYRQVPVWIGFIGNSQAIVHIYCTHPYRGKLPTIKCQRDGANSVLFDWYKTDVGQLERDTTNSTEPYNLWNYKP